MTLKLRAYCDRMGLEKAAGTALTQCLALKREESCLILYDKDKKELAEAFYREALKITPRVKLVGIPEAQFHGQEPSKEVAEELARHDVVIIVTTKSLSHTEARRNACKKGVRIASMPGLTGDIMERTLTVEYKKIKKLASKLARLLDKTKIVKIVTEKGTDIVLELNPDTAEQDDGDMTKKGSFCNLPAGEAGLAPKTANGIAVIDGVMAGIGIIDKPFRIIFKDGYAVEIGHSKLRKILASYKDKSVYHIGEFAVGCNPKARISGNVLEDEKVRGTCHIAIGDNTSYKGGKVKAPCHLDGVILKPTIYFDEKKIMEKGRLSC